MEKKGHLVMTSSVQTELYLNNTEIPITRDELKLINTFLEWVRDKNQYGSFEAVKNAFRDKGGTQHIGIDIILSDRRRYAPIDVYKN